LNLGEFGKAYISPGKGAVTAAVHAVKYLVLPLVLITVLAALVWSFTTVALGMLLTNG